MSNDNSSSTHGVSQLALSPSQTCSPEYPDNAIDSAKSRHRSMGVMDVDEAEISVGRTVSIIICITCITGIGNLLAGLLTVGIPVIASDLKISPDLQLWPAAAFALASGCTLLPCGAVADVVGCRRACLLGGILQAASALGAGLSQTGPQLIALRVVAGISASFCLPGAVGVTSNVFPAQTCPRRRSAAFAAMGGGQAIGFGLGLTAGGVYADTIGWRWGFYTAALLNAGVLILAAWALPKNVDESLSRETFGRLARDIDWVGALVISICLALFSYEVSVVTGPESDSSIRQPLNIVLLCMAFLLIPVFIWWMRRQTNLGQPALIPNAIWQNAPFRAICITVFLVWGALNASEQLTALYLQDIRGISALISSLYFLPAPVCGFLMNVAIGFLLPYLKPSFAVSTACLVSCIAPLLLATLCRIDGPVYWRGIFQAMALNPLGADLLYTVANLIMTSAFPQRTQALAGGVFNMLAQIGKSVGIATSMVIARHVTASGNSFAGAEASLKGFQASWWYNCALGFVSVGVSFWGLKSVGKLEVKRD